MAHHYRLWLEYSGDWRPLRDFLFDACKCTAFWTGPMTTQPGRPDNREREHYGMHNDYNLIDLHGGRDNRAYRNHVKVKFTLNDPDRWDEWEKDIIGAGIRWLARTPGDALLDSDELPILGRLGGGALIVNDFSNIEEDADVRAARRPDYQDFIATALQREGLAYGKGPLEPI
jgi:hypothetical protein